MKIRIAALAVIVLACNLTTAAPNAAATLDTVVTQTVSAATPAPSLAAPPSATPRPPISVTLQWPTDTPGPGTGESETPPYTSTPDTGETETQPYTRPNGTPVHAAHLSAPPTIDGDFDEWGALPLPYSADHIVYRPANWTGPGDSSASFRVGWDADALYLAVDVTDDRFAQTQSGELIFKGDSVELLFDSDLGGDYTDLKLSGDDFQLGFSPGDLTAGSPPAQTYLWYPRDRAGTPAGVTLAAKASDKGYRIETAVPWGLFNLTPSADSSYGFALSISDNDNGNTADQESMVSSVNTRRLVDPTTWGTLILDD